MGRSNLDKDKRTQKKKEKAEKNGKTATGEASETGGDGAEVEMKTPGTAVAADEAAKNKSNKAQGKKGEKKEGTGKKKARKALKKAVKRQVAEKSESIAKTLVNGFVDGNMRSAAIVMDLVEEKKKDGEKKKRDGLTAAELLGSEEQWESESFEAMEGKAELGVGGREPEEVGNRE
jgi:hypothetical protein